MKISRMESVKCPWCEKESSLGDWDDTSYQECISREQKRAYRSLADSKVWGRESKNFFKCPKCGQWVRGNKLSINSDNPTLNRLGRSPLLEVHNQKFDFRQ